MNKSQPTNTKNEYCDCECHGLFEDAGRENCEHCMPELYPEINNMTDTKNETIPEYFERLIDNYREMKKVDPEEAKKWFIESLSFYINKKS